MVAKKWVGQTRERTTIDLTFRSHVDKTMTVTYSYHGFMMTIYWDDLPKASLTSRSISMTSEPRTSCKDKFLLV